MTEQTFTIRFTEDQMKALEQFMGRVNLNAKEVPNWNALMEAFSAASDSNSNMVVDTTEE